MTNSHKTYRIGVDVGGTNTDAVILDLAPGAERPVLASHKSHTTPDVTEGIQNAVDAALSKAHIDRSRIQAVAIGTTSFVNSLVERDARVLEKVAVIRLCGPHSRLAPPFVSFPYELRAILEGPVFMADGGLQVDGRELEPVNIEEIRGICAEISKQGIKTVAISMIYAPIDREFRQEELVRDIVRAELPEVKITISKEVANIGLLQRENATILNAALVDFAVKTVAGFQASTKALQLDCPLFLTSNDGTLMSCEQAERFPIKTFSSGPTNSMRGANFLANLAGGGKPRKETALVIDVGGTTTEIGVLLPTGFPRQAGASHSLCGVSLNFSMPHVYSIGLGGGSRVREDESSGKITVGPDSVGYRIDQAISFGGETLVATDIVVAAGRATDVGDAEKVKSLDTELVDAAQARIKVMLETAIDSMKTSTQDIPVYLVGGGAILAPDHLRGVSKVHRFPFYDAANAVGAACAQISGVIDTFEDTSGGSIRAVQEQVEKRAIEKAIGAGANPANCVIVESEAIPIAYSQGRCRFYVKAAGEWSGAPVVSSAEPEVHAKAAGITKSTDTITPVAPVNQLKELPTVDRVWTVAELEAYKPNVVNKEWLISELDLEWIATGCYIMGCGGGGSPAAMVLGLKQMVRDGTIIRVIDLESMQDDGVLGWGGGVGSPEVGAERLVNITYTTAVQEIIEFLKIDNLVALGAVEIGGGNGMVNMIAGGHLSLPVVDGDFMGRAYPTGWQVTPNVYDKGNRGEMTLPCAMASGDGNVVFMTKAKHYREVDSIMRGACVEMGTAAGTSARPLTKPECQQAMIRNTISQSWRLGKAIDLARHKANLGNLGPVLIDALGGNSTAKILFSGKILEVNRKLYKGHSVGEIIIQALNAEEEEDEDPANPKPRFEGTLTIPFKNENLLAEQTVNGVTTVVAGVPDLIAVLDTGSGEALGTPDYKYGLRVLVVAVTAAPQWTDTPRGLELGALPAFGYDLPYEPVGVYVKPRSVIEEYSS